MKYVITIGVLLLLAVAALFIIENRQSVEVVPETEETTTEDTEMATTSDELGEAMEPTESDEPEEGMTVIGTSAGGNDVVAYRFGTGENHILFVGGLHGGYSWNTVLVARELVDYLTDEPDALPEDVRVTVIPLANPDGLAAVTGTTGTFTSADIPTDAGATVAGRFNANDVDLNRNFDCEWEATGTWQNRSVSGGDAPFSEPEAAAIRDYVDENEPDAAVIYYSAAGGVFASNCRNGVSEETRTLTNTYADAANYQAFESYDFYEITGDMANWLAGEDIPAISVLLSTHTDVEWDKNRAGVDAVLNAYSN